ncbi:MAG: amidophosphoribosyltransferase [Spirochaetia bacterium]|nr:amidophosphoribosyltransferase [Spirochaetia bacterium]MDD5777138.1 amidophosphoribosyltransferase [Treponema sp.]MCI5608518.1 amidophosphoribosyltransferase [Spirochaetia bacterium]MCI6826262.1 amidophosphoribosyltransferase [Spirochaetia bacterium]MCI7109668.1 amidophosphoribosyltransferase [Spirochaetia bacterium]
MQEFYNECEDKFHDECGVVGVYLNPEDEKIKAGKKNAAVLSYYALVSLQHRGQESAGICVSDGENVKIHKAMGLVSDVFNLEHLTDLNGFISVGHVRYATAGSKTIENAQPMLIQSKLGSVAVAHNGQLVNYVQLREMFEETGATFSSSSDTEVIVKLIARGYKKGLERALTDTIQMIKGSFALCVMTKDALIGARDSNGIRPLCLGQVEGGWVLASESCAIDAMNGIFVRDIRPGEIVIINQDGVLSFDFGEKTSKRSCIFEYVYFARPDSIIDGISVQEARYKMGEQLAKESPVEADVVVGVPDSGLGAAMGYARASGIPYAMGVVKNKYIGRTFIAPTQKDRENMVFVKLNALKNDLYGKRVIVIDDSIVRGTTSRRLVQILKRAGAKEVHFRVSSAPVKFPCHLGIDTPTKAELISSGHDVEEVRKEIGADSLAFISVEGMFEALRSCNKEQYGFCKGCFTGEYPMAILNQN